MYCPIFLLLKSENISLISLLSSKFNLFYGMGWDGMGWDGIGWDEML
jgi:hypothetical protein